VDTNGKDVKNQWVLLDKQVVKILMQLHPEKYGRYIVAFFGAIVDDCFFCLHEK
jgi:hypothetical protein